MKVAIVSSSPNKVGLTNSCVDICKSVLIDKDCEVNSYCLNNYNIKKCEACGERGWGICLNEYKCRIEDDFNTLKDEINEHDVFIIISPVYFYEISESAKTFFDRLKRCESFNEKSKLKSKKLLCIACAGGSGDGTVPCLESMKILAKFLHVELIGGIGITKKNFEENKENIAQSALTLIGSESF